MLTQAPEESGRSLHGSQWAPGSLLYRWHQQRHILCTKYCASPLEPVITIESDKGRNGPKKSMLRIIRKDTPISKYHVKHQDDCTEIANMATKLQSHKGTQYFALSFIASENWGSIKSFFSHLSKIPFCKHSFSLFRPLPSQLPFSAVTVNSQAITSSLHMQ